MGADSKIEWTDHTFNPWIGCTPVSAACDHCYAETMASRYGWAKWGVGEARKRTSIANWRNPLKWNAEAAKDGRRAKVFCASLADVFDAEVSDEWRVELFELISITGSLDWLLLTKRPKLMAQWPIWPGNVWAGTTVENQQMADARIPHLLDVPTRVRFLSCEPLLGPISIRGDFLAGINWVIVGGESGRGARPMNPGWARAIRDQCQAAGVAFFFKQWGEHEPGILDRKPGEKEPWRVYPDGNRVWSLDELGKTDLPTVRFSRVGKKAAGRLLDGREHSAFPASLPQHHRRQPLSAV